MEDSRKRQRTHYENRGPVSKPVLEINEEDSGEVQELEDPWAGMSLFALEEPATQMMPNIWQRNTEMPVQGDYGGSKQNPSSGRKLYKIICNT